LDNPTPSANSIGNFANGRNLELEKSRIGEAFTLRPIDIDNLVRSGQRFLTPQ